MFDYNFFEGYKRSRGSGKKKTSHAPLFIFLIYLFVMLLIGGYTFWTMVRTGAEIAIVTAEINAPENQETLARITDKQNLITQLQSMNDSLATAPETLAQTNPINRALMDSVLNSLPADAQLTDITYDQTSVTMSGKAGLRSAVAEFERNLRLALPEAAISVPGITLSENEYAFSLTIGFGGGEDASVE